MRHVPGRSLWIGHAGDLWDTRAVMDAGFAAVLELADNERPAVLPHDCIHCRFPLSDGGENPLWLLRLVAESVSAHLRAGVPMLICCSGGMSRSVCAAAAGIALADGCPLAFSLPGVIGLGPADVSPGLLKQFQLALGQ